MSLFVDFVGLNTLVSSSISSNTLLSARNGAIGTIAPENELVGINLHRNGPYGYPTWKQLRVSENPITRHHNKNNTMTFVTQPGKIRNVLTNGELRIRDRYSKINSFTEPVITQKSYPLVWNVGRHTVGPGGRINLSNPERFSIISSFQNQFTGFANKDVDEKLKIDFSNNETEYDEIYNLYAEDGLNSEDSPLTYWEFLQYRETVYPHMKNQFQNENLERPNFISFYRHKRSDRTIIISNPYKKGNSGTDLDSTIAISRWPLDAQEDFLTTTTLFEDKDPRAWTGDFYVSNSLGDTRGAPGILQNTHNLLGTRLFNERSASSNDDVADLNTRFSPAPIYSRPHTYGSSLSLSNRSGIKVTNTGSFYIEIIGSPSATNLPAGGGQALWEAGATRQVKDENGDYIDSPKNPFYDTYEGYIQEARKRYKNFSVIPEFRISTQISNYTRNSSEIQTDVFSVTGGVDGAQDSSQSKFYEIYSNSDFMRQFELIDNDHKEFTNAKVLSLRCKAIKKLLPYEGFYPAQRTVDLVNQFYSSYGNNIKLIKPDMLSISASIDLQMAKQFVTTPLFAPGILFNTIKSGIAVDYPTLTGSEIPNVDNSLRGYQSLKSDFNFRIPFEAILDPKDFLAGVPIGSLEPHYSASWLGQGHTGNPYLNQGIWDGTGDNLYKMISNNFFASCIDFFLPNGQLTTIASKQKSNIELLKKDQVYGMRIKMARSMDKARIPVFKSGSTQQFYVPQDIILSGGLHPRETFTMYSRPSAFGPPTRGANPISGSVSTQVGSMSDINSFEEQAGLDIMQTNAAFGFVSNNSSDPVDGASKPTIFKDSYHGYNFPHTPPYYHGEAWCDIFITGSGQELTIRQLQNAATYFYSRFDSSYYLPPDNVFSTGSFGPQSFHCLNDYAVQLSASLNLRSVGTIKGERKSGLVVDTGVQEEERWIIQTKFETPMLNFNHISSGSGNITLPQVHSESVPRGMWHQYGRIPEENEGVFLSVEAIPNSFKKQVLGKQPREILDLKKALGFSGAKAKIGQIRGQKTIFEAVVAVPFVEEQEKRKFFSLDKQMVDLYKEGGTIRQTLVNGDPDGQIGRSVLDQLEKMQKYVFPPSFDFINNSTEEVQPIAMYIFEFSHTLTQQDLSDIWQNLPPEIGTTMEESEIAITHPLLKKELLGPGGEKGNTKIDMHNKLKWMVFKVKQRAETNYFKKTASSNFKINQAIENSNVSIDEFGETSNIQFNWPYDFFSLVELVRLDAEVELGNADFSNYTAHLPPWDAVIAGETEIAKVLSEPEVDEVDLADYLGYQDPDDRPPDIFDGGESGQGNRFIRDRQQQLDDTIETMQERIAAQLGQGTVDPENVQPGGVAAMFGEVDEAAGGAGGITGAMGGPLEEMGEGDGNDSAQDGDNFDQNNQSGLGGAPDPGANV